MRYLFLFTFILMSSFGHSQSYQLIPDSCMFCYSRHTLGGSQQYGKYYFVDPSVDTLLLGNSYKRVFYGGNMTSSYGPQPFGVRQEGNKLYGVVDTLQEHLIMDFDALVGDTITQLFSEGSFYDAVVLAKDSVLISGTSYHHWMELEGQGYVQNGWNFMWHERSMCSGYYSPTGSLSSPYGGINFNLPWNEMIIEAAYIEPHFCSSGTLYSNPPDYECQACQLTSVSLEELFLDEVEVVKIIDLMGRESEDNPNTLLIYIYSDGTSEKVFRIE